MNDRHAVIAGENYICDHAGAVAKVDVREWWFARRQHSDDKPAEADVYYSLSSRPSTTCVARSVAADSITR